MKLLFDQNISHRLVRRVISVFPEAKQVRELGLEGESDHHIWDFAKQNDFTIVTFDGDFYDFSIIWGHPPKVIWIRSYNQTTHNIERVLRKYEKSIKDFDEDLELACLEILDAS